MEQCLVKELKGVVTDSNLPIFSGFILNLVQQTHKTINRIGGYDAEHPVWVKTKNCNVYKNESLQDNPCYPYGNYALDIRDMSANPNVIISDLYNLGYFRFVNMDGSGNLDGSTPNDWFIDCSVFKLSKEVKTLDLSRCSMIGKTEDFVNMTKVETLSFSVAAANQTSHIDFVDLVKAWINNGRANSGSITTYAESGCYFNGVKLSSYHIYSERTLIWESSSKIYLSFGTYILCVGYSDSEIATNTASGGIWDGKTVQKCD